MEALDYRHTRALKPYSNSEDGTTFFGRADLLRSNKITKHKSIPTSPKLSMLLLESIQVQNLIITIIIK